MTISAELIEQMHAHSSSGVISLTGGGSLGLGQLLSVPGASATLLEAIVPYAHDALVDWLGYTPDQACSPQTALQMATRSLARAEELTFHNRDSAKSVWGLGVTAALASSRPKRGEHRVFIAIHQPHQTSLLKVIFEKGVRSREEEETLVGKLMLQQLASTLLLTGVPHPQQLGLTDRDQWQQLQAGGNAETLVMKPEEHPVSWWDVSRQQPVESPERICGLLSGSFNPLHQAHQQLLQLAKDKLGGDVYFELSLHNADKPALDYLSLQKRLMQFQQQKVLLSHLPTFVEKSTHFPETVFVIGADTAARVIDKRFYQFSEERLLKALDEIAERGCRFLVAARPIDGTILSLKTLGVPKRHLRLFEEIPEQEFLLEMSSTQLRADDKYDF